MQWQKKLLQIVDKSVHVVVLQRQGAEFALKDKKGSEWRLRARVKYKKGEEVKYVGHLDTMRTFTRCLKRSAIPLKFSGGFNPRVQISFALPLGVGVTSESEYFDLVVEDKMNGSIFLGELNSVLPLGFRAISVEFLDEDDKKSLMSLVKEAIYEIRIKGDYKASDVEEFFKNDKIEIEKESKEKKVSTINLKNFIIDFKAEDIEKYNNNLLITVHATAGSNNNLNPNYIVQAIEKYIGKVEDFDIHRKELILAV